MWEYDGAGNILCRHKYPYTPADVEIDTEPLDTVYYGYQDGTDRLTYFDGKVVEGDAMGVYAYDGWHYVYGQGTRLVEMWKEDPETQEEISHTFTYNAEGMRIQRTCDENDCTYHYVYDGSLLTQMSVAGNVLRFTYDAIGTPLTVIYEDITYYYVVNLQGDIVAILDSTGTAVVTYTYDAWGNILSTTGTHALATLNPLRYRGYVYDTETGLYYLQSRYYNPQWGRFISADCFVSTGQGVLGYNMFAYCGNNPVLLVDSLGTRPISTMTVHEENYARTSSGELERSISCRFMRVLSVQTPTCIDSRKRLQLIVAQTIYGEEHGRLMYNDWQQGQRAVAAVILNRKNAAISYLGKDLETICTNGQFDGYFAGKAAYEAGLCDSVAWDAAMTLAGYVVSGDYDSLCVPAGMTTNHLYFNETSTFWDNVNSNNGKFYFGPGTILVTPRGVVSHGGNRFFYY